MWARTSSLKARILARQLATLGDPLGPATIEQPDVVVPEEAEHPQGVGSPPVRLVAVDDDGRVPGDAARAHHLGEAGAIDVVPRDRVVEVEVPVELEGARDMAGVVEQDVLVGLQQRDAVGTADPSRLELLGEPVRGDQSLWMRIGRDLGLHGRRVFDCHGVHGVTASRTQDRGWS
jgi:hypothetical protein